MSIIGREKTMLFFDYHVVRLSPAAYDEVSVGAFTGGVARAIAGGVEVYLSPWCGSAEVAVELLANEPTADTVNEWSAICEVSFDGQTGPMAIGTVVGGDDSFRPLELELADLTYRARAHALRDFDEYDGVAREPVRMLIQLWPAPGSPNSSIREDRVSEHLGAPS